MDQNQIIQRGRPRPVLHVGWGQFSDVAIQKSKSLFDIRKKSHKPNKSDYLQSFGVQNFCWLRGQEILGQHKLCRREMARKRGGGGWGLLFAAPLSPRIVSSQSANTCLPFAVPRQHVLGCSFVFILASKPRNKTRFPVVPQGSNSCLKYNSEVHEVSSV